MFRWYVINTYSGHENKVKHNLEHRVQTMGQARKVRQVVVPTEQVQEIKDGRKVNVEKRTMPGYVLVQMEMTDEAWGLVKNTPGVTGFVGSRNKPLPLSQSEVDNLLHTETPGAAPAAAGAQGGGGADTLAGGPGADFFVYHELAASTGASPDTILDFDGSDGFMFVGIDAQPTSSKVQEFTWHEGLHNYQELQTGEFGFVLNATGGTLFARTDSDSIIDFHVDVTFSGPVTFTASSVHQESVFLV